MVMVVVKGVLLFFSRPKMTQPYFGDCKEEGEEENCCFRRFSSLD